MARFNYEDLIGDNVQFLQGTQAQLNLYLPSAPATIPSGFPNAGNNNTFKGNATEGAFYLTTDTHRLYVGRKVKTLPSPNPYNVAVDEIYPEEVSTGIATVADSGELSNVQTGGAAHDGDFYYIKNSNVLAVYKENAGATGGSWVQINSPTGIGSFGVAIAANTPTTTPTFSAGANYVRVKSSISTPGNDTPMENSFWLKAGDNVTLKPSAENNAIEISSANSQSTLKVSDTEVTAATNKAPVILTDGVNADTQVYFVGASDTTVDSKVDSSENIVTITGPGVKGAKVTNRGTVGSTSGNAGFEIAIEVKNGAKNETNDKTLASNGSVFDPIITIGENSDTDVHFRGGKAQLDVYTTSEVDEKITNRIQDELQAADALRYKGTVDSSNALAALDDGTVHAGDVYKASAKFTYSGTAVKTGDLLIAKGDEHVLSADTAVIPGKTYYTRSGSAGNYTYTKVTNPTGNPSTSNYYELGAIPQNGVTWEVIPSGDEPVLVGQTVNHSNGPQFGLEDANIAAPYSAADGLAARLAKRPLYVSFDNANSTLVHATSTGDSADQMVITLHHQAPASGNITTVTSETVKAASGTDSLTTKDQVATFTAIKSITRDAYGHVTGVAGETITLKHNYIDQITATHSVANNVGTIVIGASDALGITDTALSSAGAKGNLKIGSDTLTIGASNDNTQLNINLKWGSF